jgi:hypothetical protein
MDGRAAHSFLPKGNKSGGQWLPARCCCGAGGDGHFRLLLLLILLILRLCLSRSNLLPFPSSSSDSFFPQSILFDRALLLPAFSKGNERQ